ncbi:NB-ARC domains-containing protein [Tanacetum coccineum]
MATASIPHQWKYDIFVSFRGEDIRRSFMDHLFNDFKQKGISPHLDSISSGGLQTLNTKRYWWDKTLLVTTKGRKRLLAYTRRRGTRVGSAKGNPFVFAVNATQEKRRDTHRLEKGRVGKAL